MYNVYRIERETQERGDRPMVKVTKSDKIAIRISDRATLKFRSGWMVVDATGKPIVTNGRYECYNTKKVAQMQADYLNRDS